jgi:Outer membrane cytochrome MtrC/MtrF-like, domains II/IV
MTIIVRFLARSFLWGLAVLILPMLHPLWAAAAGPYAASAHGNKEYGVLRTILDGSYIRGNCGHCHEQHSNAADGYLLIADGFDSTKITNPYNQLDNVCFQCHATSGSVQLGGIVNNPYGTTFGGETTTVTSIMAAFNQASYHNLYDLKRYITGDSGSRTFSNFPEKSNPCSGCHNIHIAKANKRTPGKPTYTAISKPSEHNSLWGDDTSPNEQMTAYGTDYQPPLYAGSTTHLEPDGTGSDKATQAAKTPDYNTFCIDCHNSSNIIYSTTLLRNLRTFDWDLEVHGAGAAVNWTEQTEMMSPYTETGLGSYLLSCMDCHEPHGSSNEFLLRSSVNNNSVVLPNNLSDWKQFCVSCHNGGATFLDVHHEVANTDCNDCHEGGTMEVVNCINCHYHGSYSEGHKTF